jgi:glycosyltransferase involved in cell wall biosynthesis
MRIVHILDRADAIGGVQTYLSELLPALAERGIESTVVTGTSGIVPGAEMVLLEGIADDGPRLPASVIGGLRDVLRARKPDLVVQQVAYSPSLAVAASAHAPVVVHTHDYFMTCPGGARYLHSSGSFCAEGHGLRCFPRAYTERTTNRRPDRLLRAYRRTTAWEDVWPLLRRVLVASQFVGDVHERRGISHDSIRVVAYPVTPLIGEPPADDAPDVLYVGRLIDSKGVHVLLGALAQLPGVTAAIAGDGPARDSLEELAAQLGITDRVRFLGWIEPRRRTSLYRGSRVFALPSLWDEPFGIVGVEALGAGLPVVASAAGGVPDWLEDGVTGTLVPRGDATALAGALATLLNDRDRHARYSDAARRVPERFAMARHLELLLPALGLE